MPVMGILLGSLYVVIMVGVFYCEEDEDEDNN
jgi:hypothetical protein